MSYSIPILVLAFNRVQPAQGLLKILQELRPVNLYLAFDGPRPTHPRDEARCESVRTVFRDGINWPCQISWLIREQNLGCRFGVSTAIDWFFAHETEGVILEDDIHPLPGFFSYCAELLDRYREDSRIGCISANNHQPLPPSDGASYYFSIYSHCWGWATWRRAWLAYREAESLWPEFHRQGWLRQLGGLQFEKRWSFLINQVCSGDVQAWDVLWQLACWQQGFLTCLPAFEQVKNVGFDADATHTIDEHSPLKPPQELDYPLVHPRFVLPAQDADERTFRRLYRRRLSKDLYRKVLKAFRLIGLR